jgi:hypothetical protein
VVTITLDDAELRIGNSVLVLHSTMSDQEAFKKFMQQLQKAGSGGRGFSGGPKGFLTGSGLILALIAGGVALNASLFNGAS